jgi:vacuolar-type H+-ATPase subunit H
MTTEATTGPGDSLETIKLVTSVESDLERKLVDLRASIKLVLEALHRETESTLVTARAEADKEREAALATSRTEGDHEAELILTAGAARAGSIRGKSSDELARQKEPVLTAILAEFRSPGKRPAP